MSDPGPRDPLEEFETQLWTLLADGPPPPTRQQEAAAERLAARISARIEELLRAATEGDPAL